MCRETRPLSNASRLLSARVATAHRVAIPKSGSLILAKPPMWTSKNGPGYEPQPRIICKSLSAP
jgi:hypothetical protein